MQVSMGISLRPESEDRKLIIRPSVDKGWRRRFCVLTVLSLSFGASPLWGLTGAVKTNESDRQYRSESS
jgi:hypothetical protein